MTTSQFPLERTFYDNQSVSIGADLFLQLVNFHGKEHFITVSLFSLERMERIFMRIFQISLKRILL